MTTEQEVDRCGVRPDGKRLSDSQPRSDGGRLGSRDLGQGHLLTRGQPRSLKLKPVQKL